MKRCKNLNQLYCTAHLDCVRRFVVSGDNVGESKPGTADFVLLLTLEISSTSCLLADLSRGGRGIPDERSSDFLGGEILFSFFVCVSNRRSSLLLVVASVIDDIPEGVVAREPLS